MIHIQSVEPSLFNLFWGEGASLWITQGKTSNLKKKREGEVYLEKAKKNLAWKKMNGKILHIIAKIDGESYCRALQAAT